MSYKTGQYLFLEECLECIHCFFLVTELEVHLFLCWGFLLFLFTAVRIDKFSVKTNCLCACTRTSKLPRKKINKSASKVFHHFPPEFMKWACPALNSEVSIFHFRESWENMLSTEANGIQHIKTDWPASILVAGALYIHHQQSKGSFSLLSLVLHYSLTCFTLPCQEHIKISCQKRHMHHLFKN